MGSAVVLALALECIAVGHVRADEPEVQTLIQEGLERSETFRAVVAKLAETDVVAYVRTAFIKGGLGGFVPHRVAVHPAGRYVVAAVTKSGSRNRRIGVIAHELTHVLEIGREPKVGRTQEVGALFARIGRRHGFRGSYETGEAVAVEAAVRREHARPHEGNGCL